MRPIRTVRYSSHFARQYQRLAPSIQLQAENRESSFRKDAFDPLLRTHKLKGKLAENWAYSVTHHFRIMFRFLQKDEVIFLAIGSHDEVY